MQYRTKYAWGMEAYDDYSSGGKTMGIMTGRLNLRYRISEGASLQHHDRPRLSMYFAPIV